MKHISYIFLLSVLVASCANLTSPKATVTPQATSTLTSTFTPTITPTITLTPTETPDPNMPSDATGKDPLTGEYIKSIEEDGKVIEYIWKDFQFGDDAQNGIKGHWFKSMMENGSINLTGYDEICTYWEGGFPLNMNVYALEGQTNLEKFGNIYHPDRAAEWQKYNSETSGSLSCSSTSLTNTITRDLHFRYLGLLSGDPGNEKYNKYNELCGAAEGREKCDPKKFVDFINSGGTIQVGDGLWSPPKGYDFYWINEDMAENDPSMHLSVQASGTIKNFYWKIFVKDGKLIAIIAPSNWLKEKLAREKVKREIMFRSIILFPLEAAIVGANPNEDLFFLLFQDYGGYANTISGWIKGKTIIIRTPFIDFAFDK